MAIAIAGEFGAIDAEAVRTRLDRLASGLSPLAGFEPERRARILIARLGGGEGLDRGRETRPESLMIDRVLALRRGHPLSLVIVYAAVARRAGFDLHPIGNERVVLLADNSASPPLAVDPVPGGRRVPGELRWLCPHVVGALMLGALAVRWRQAGELRLALRALELRLMFPLAPGLRVGHEHELRALQALLN